MVMINQFDLIGDTDVDDPLQIALVQMEILKKKAAAAKKAADDAAAVKKAAADAAAAAADAAAAAVADLKLPVEESQKGVLDVPEGGIRYQDRRGYQNRRGSGRNFENNRNVDGIYPIPEYSAQDFLGKPSKREHSDQPYRGRGGGRGYLNRDNGEYAGRPARRQYERQNGVSSPPAKVNGELSPLVKDVPVPHVELGTTDEQNLEENATSEGKSSNPELDNAPTSNALNKNKEGMANGREEKEPEVKVMTLEEYQKVLEGKRKDLVAKLMLIKTTEERKVEVNKEFESMQQLVDKKENNEFFIKLGNDKEAGKRKEDTKGDDRVKKDTEVDDRVKKDTEGEVKKDTDRPERVKKVFRKFEFLTPAERGRGGRGQGWRGGRGGQGGLGVQGERGGQGWRGGRGGQVGLGDQGELGFQNGLGGQGGIGSQGERGVQGGRGGRGGQGGRGGRGGRGYSSSFSDESIKDPRQFPFLGGKEVEQPSSAQWKVEPQQQQQQQQQQSPAAAQGRK